MYQDAHLPTPLTIILNGPDEPVGSDPDTRYEAASPQFPELVGTGDGANDAVDALLHRILDEQPLPPDVTSALHAAGHSQELIQTWHARLVGENRRYRYDAEAAVSLLNQYAQAGVPPLIACQYLTLRIRPVDAGQAHAAGGTPMEAVAYMREAEGRRGMLDFDYIPWIVAAFPFERGHLYTRTCSVGEAAQWEAVVAECGISDEDLSVILNTLLTPAEALDLAATCLNDGIEFQDAVRHQRPRTVPTWSDPWLEGLPVEDSDSF